MTVYAITFRSQNDSATTIRADLDAEDPSTFANQAINFVQAGVSGLRPLYATTTLDAGEAATFALNGSANGPTTVMTITSDETLETLRADLLTPAAGGNGKEFAKRLIGYLSGLAGGLRNGSIQIQNTAAGLDRTHLYGRAA